MSAVMTEELIKALSKPFGGEAVRQKRGQGNRMMDYVSHGMVTKRLNDVYPGWHAEMVEKWIVGDGDKLHCLGGVMRMTIGGVTREEAGGPTRQGTLADDLKNTYSDCLKRCAMRFGVALDMWESAEENDEDAEPMPYVKGAEGVGPWDTDTRANRAPQPTSATRSNGSAPTRAAQPPTPQRPPQQATANGNGQTHAYRDIPPQPPYAPQRAVAAEIAARSAEPLSDQGFDNAISAAWMAFHEGKVYETAVMGLNAVRGRFNDAQRATALDEVSKLRKAYRERDDALAVPSAPRHEVS